MMKWYVVQVLAGYEDRVRADLLKRVQEQSLEESFGEILLPATKSKSASNAAEEDAQYLFPGYILVEMALETPAMRLVSQTPRVSRFLGGTNPVLLSDKEVERFLAQMRGEVVVSVEKHSFDTGSEVEIMAGPFAGFVGIIDAIDEEHEKLTVMVSIFGRMTPVVLQFDQVKR